MKSHMFAALAAWAYLGMVPLHVRAASTELSTPSPSEPASADDEKALWKTVERLSFATVAGTDSLRRAAALEGGRASDGSPSYLPIGERLAGTNVVLRLDPAGKPEKLSFDLRGGCISMRTLLSQYPNLLLLHIPRGRRGSSLVGATIGEALTTFRMTPGPGPCAVGVTVQTIETARSQMLLR